MTPYGTLRHPTTSGRVFRRRGGLKKGDDDDDDDHLLEAATHDGRALPSLSLDESTRERAARTHTSSGTIIET